MDKVNFSHRLIEERKRLALSQEAFAKFGGVTRPTQARYEDDLKRIPTVEYLDGLAKAGVDVVYLISGKRIAVVAENDAAYTVKLYTTPNDAFLAVAEIQKELNFFFPGDQLQSVIGFAWTAQASKAQLIEFIRGAYTIAGLELPKQLLAIDEQAAKDID